MKPDSQDCVLDLLPAQVLRLRAAPGVTIICDGGTLWVTQEGMARDDFLSAGESLCIACAGMTLVEAVGGSGSRNIRVTACSACSIVTRPGKTCDGRGSAPSSRIASVYPWSRSRAVSIVSAAPR